MIENSEQEWMTRVGTALALVRFRSNMTRNELAKKAGIDADLVGEIESGDCEFSLEHKTMVEALCKAVGRTSNNLLEYSREIYKKSANNGKVRETTRSLRVRKAR